MNYVYNKWSYNTKHTNVVIIWFYLHQKQTSQDHTRMSQLSCLFNFFYGHLSGPSGLFDAMYVDLEDQLIHGVILVPEELIVRYPPGN